MPHSHGGGDHFHHEHHFRSTDAVRDVVIGMSDGLTVPFALAAGLSGAHVATSVVVLAGLAEIAAGSIAMGLGGYLAARTDAEHYQNELLREHRETKELPEKERAEVEEVFAGFGLTPDQIQPITATITADEKRWVDFMMKFELNLEAPDPLPGGSQRFHNRRVLYRGRHDPFSAVLCHAGSGKRPDRLGGRHSFGSVRFWGSKGEVYGNPTVARGFPDRSDRRPRSGGRVLDRKTISVT